MSAVMIRIACLSLVTLLASQSASAAVVGKAVTPTIAEELNVSSFVIGLAANHNAATAPIADSGRWVRFSSTGNFQDAFGYAARSGGNEAENVVNPNPSRDFVDDSLFFAADEVGIIAGGDNASDLGDFDNFFAVSDTVNPDNAETPNAPYTATWAFNIAGAAGGLSVSIDMAAMGDFEPLNTASGADWFNFEYSYDGVTFLPAFTSAEVETSFTPLLPNAVSFAGQIDQSVAGNDASELPPEVVYEMASGSLIALNDYITMNGVALDNTFQTLTANVGTATSNTLTLRLSATANGGSEVFAFRNIVVEDGGVAPGLAGDYNGDNVVDAADYTVWRDGGSPDDTQAGYDLWADNYGATAPATSAAIPEPTAALLAMIALAGLASRRG